MAINNVCISGNVCADCEKFTAGETPAISFAIAVNEYSKDKEFTNFFDCVIFGNRAKGVAPYIVKGAKVFITGRLRQDRWEAEDGTNRSRVRIIVSDLDFSIAKKVEDKEPAEPAKKGKKKDASADAWE